jgi:DNA integrity scanning protein DisA with diadenylate cyclase activity
MPTRWLQRLADEFDDDGIALPADRDFRRLLFEELDHCRRTPMFEGRRPTYGAIVVPRGRAPAHHRAALDGLDYDLVPLDDDPAAGRVYADGRASFLVRSVDGGMALACFAGSMLMEADLVQLQRTTGAAIIQRTPVLDVVRIAVDESMVTWDGRHWHRRPTAIAMADDLIERVPELDSSFALHVLELAVHWLAPSRIGATIVVHDDDHIDWSALDTSTAARTPQLSVCDRRHFSALTTVLRQHDLAVIVDRRGSLRKVAVGLRWTTDAEAAVSSDRGMRHRSAQRYSHDHPSATVVVVSEDGPVSVFRGGAVAVASTVVGPRQPSVAGERS